jgi:DNA ligase-1
MPDSYSVIRKPMLAEKCTVDDLDNLPYPMWGTPKFDGIRCLKVNGRALSRTFKPIPNEQIRKYIEKYAVDGMDGELVAYREGSDNSFNDSQCVVMKEVPEFSYTFKYYVFDFAPPGQLMFPYLDRVRYLKLSGVFVDKIEIVTPVRLDNKEEVLNYEADCIADGYEGVCMRTGDSFYKCGRSTLKQAWLLKMKRFADGEAEVIGFEEQTTNMNESYKNEVGHTKRATCKEGMVPNGTLGKFLVRDLKTGVEFEIGTFKGVTKEDRKNLWETRMAHLGRIIHYRYQECGMKDKPRIASFQGFRDEKDL